MDMDIKRAENKLKKAEGEAKTEKSEIHSDKTKSERDKVSTNQTWSNKKRYPELVRINKRKVVRGKADSNANLKTAVTSVKYTDDPIRRKFKDEKKVESSVISRKSKVPIKKAAFIVSKGNSGHESIRKKRFRDARKHQQISKSRSVFDRETDSSQVSIPLTREEQIGKQKSKYIDKKFSEYSVVSKKTSEDANKEQERKEEVKKSAKDRNVYIKKADKKPSDSKTTSHSRIKKTGHTVKKVNNKVNRISRAVKFLDSEEKTAYMKEAVKGSIKQKMQQKIYIAMKKPMVFLMKIIAKISIAIAKYLIGLAVSLIGVLLVPILFFLLLFTIFTGGYNAINATAGNVVSQVPLYLQYDERWGTNAYGNETIASSGCGPTSVAMVVSYFLQEEITPDQVVNWAGNTYYVNGVGTSFDMYPAAADNYGLICNNIPASQVTEDLSEGRIVIASAGPGIFTTEGHLIVLRGIDSEGNILVNDPNDSDTKNHFNTPFSPSVM